MLKNNIVLKNISGTFILKISSFLISFGMMPCYISYFDNQVTLGIWYTMLSIFSWIFTFDMGIGNGLRNKLSVLITKNALEEQGKLISSAYIILGGIVLVVIIFFIPIIGYLDWNSIFNVSQDMLAPSILKRTVLIVFGGIIVQFWLNNIISILLALQKNILASSFNVVSNAAILVFLQFKSTNSIEEKLIILSIVYITAISIPLIIATVYVFTSILKNVKVSLINFDFIYAKDIASLGIGFFIVQLGLLVINSTNPFLITRIFGSADVVTYQVYFKFYSILSVIFTIFTQPVWSAVTVAWAKRDIGYIKKLETFLFCIAIIGSISAFLIIPFMQGIVNVWLEESAIVISKKIASIFAIYYSFEMLMLACTCIANGISHLRCQYICIPIAAIIKVPLSYFLADVMGSWSAIIVAHAIVLLPVILFQPFLLRKAFNKEKL